MHVGQIADYVSFDNLVRDLGDFSQLQSMPIGFQEFAGYWNNHATPDDHRRFCDIVFPEGADLPTISIPQHPVPIEDFLITPIQVGHGDRESHQEPVIVQQPTGRNHARNSNYHQIDHSHKNNGTCNNNRKGYEKRRSATTKVKPGEKALSRLNFTARGPRCEPPIPTNAPAAPHTTPSTIDTSVPKQEPRPILVGQSDVTMQEPTPATEGVFHQEEIIRV